MAASSTHVCSLVAAAHVWAGKPALKMVRLHCAPQSPMLMREGLRAPLLGSIENILQDTARRKNTLVTTSKPEINPAAVSLCPHCVIWGRARQVEMNTLGA